MFDCEYLLPYAVTDGCVWGKACIYPCVTDDFGMHKVVERDAREFIRPGGTKKCIVKCELRQDFIEVVLIYKNQIPRVNGMKDFRREGIELCAIFSMNSSF